ncbi:MAG: hypothetical protein RDV41_16020, partial [Planctomycetota bacterium]|nr:hypothetical protein [Planctomycetota bacterium]
MKTRIHLLAATAVLLLFAASASPQQKPGAGKAAWQPVGLSGGGAMFAPAISPADPKLMMINCDMSGAYITTDGGQNWKMIHLSQLRSSTRCKPAFHPTDTNIIYAAQGWQQGMKISKDGGEKWEGVGNLPGEPIGEIAIDPGNPGLMLTGVEEDVYRSADAGKNWSRCEGPRGTAIAFHFDQTSPVDRRACLAATSEGIWRSDDGGKKWARKTTGIPGNEFYSFTGGSNAKAKLIVLYCTVPSKEESGKLAGGIYRSLDRGESWQPVMNKGLNLETKAFDQWA